MCPVSPVTCQVSHVTIKKIYNKVIELVGGGSVFCIIYIAQIYNRVFTIIFISPAPYCKQQSPRIRMLVYDYSEDCVGSWAEKIYISREFGIVMGSLVIYSWPFVHFGLDTFRIGIEIDDGFLSWQTPWKTVGLTRRFQVLDMSRQFHVQS